MTRTDQETSSLNLYLIRHGETEWSQSGQYTGRTDIPLTAHGREIAKQLGESLRTIPFSRVFTSPLLRAQETCQWANLSTATEIDVDLAEWDNGQDEGRTPAEILALRPGWNLFRDGSPGGESPVQIAKRADRFIERMRALEGNIALFSHSHFGRILAARWIELSVEYGQHFLFDTASLSILSYEHKRKSMPAISLWNSAVPNL